MRGSRPEAVPLPNHLDLLLAAASGALLGLAFPKWGLWPLAWVGLVPLLIALQGARPGRGFVLGYVAGAVQFGIVLYWITYVTSTYGGMNPLAASGIMLLLVLYLSIYPGLFGLGLAWLGRAGLPVWLAAAPLWAGLEYLRGVLFTGFPWAELGASQYSWVGFIQAADLGGVALLSFLVVLVNGALATAWLRRSPRRVLLPGLVALVALSLGLTYGDLRVQQIERLAAAAPHLSVAVVQGNIDQGSKWRDGEQGKSVEAYRDLTLEAARGKPDLIIWPETSLPFYFLEEGCYTPQVLGLAEGLRAYLLLGCPAYEEEPGGGLAYFNRAWLLAPGGQPVAKYDKVHLVPWGEYVPLKRYMPFLTKAVGGTIGNFHSGGKVQCLELDGPKRARLGVLICFESIFPDLAREAAKGGATLLANITNDAWFGTTSAPYQHFSMSVLRAVETRRALVRAANTGISGFIGPGGRVLAATALRERAQRSASVPLMRLETVYTRFGDVFAWACLAIAAGLAAVAYGRRNSHDNDS